MRPIKLLFSKAFCHGIGQDGRRCFRGMQKMQAFGRESRARPDKAAPQKWTFPDNSLKIL
jgi:hypothetical protein